MKERFDLEVLDQDDPFELDDGNIPHLAKHAPFTADDALDAWIFGQPLFYPAAEDGPADWLMVGRIPGAIIVVPLAQARSGGPGQMPTDRDLRAEPITRGALRGGLAKVSDAEAFEHYDDPSKREPAPGAPHRRSERPLTQHVPVRFPAETIDQVRRLAEADGMTVSAWIRRAVERMLRQRGATGVERAEAGDDARTVVERLQRDVADLAAALDRSSQPR